jgi:anti-sigma B factor antagonist
VSVCSTGVPRPEGIEVTALVSHAELEDKLHAIPTIISTAPSRLDDHELMMELLERTGAIVRAYTATVLAARPLIRRADRHHCRRAGQAVLAVAAEDYKIRWMGPHAIITMPAEIDMTNADEIRQALLSAASDGAAVLIIDMSGTMFCDSAGVQAIIAAQEQAVTTGTQLRLAATAVLRILTVIGADQLIPVYPNLAAALAGGTRPPA